MKKILLTSAILCLGILMAQNNKLSLSAFDEAKTLQEAKARGIAAVDYAGYVEHQRRHWMLENGLLKPQQNSKKIKPNAVSSATNMGFENGDYTGWLTQAGDNMTSSNGPLTNIRLMTPGPIDTLPTAYCSIPDSARQGLMTNLYNDPLAGITLASPLGGNYVARLNRYCYNYEGSILSQTFPVTANQNILNYAYATVLQDGGHAWGEQTYFKVKVTDQSGGLIDSVYMQAANGTTPGFYQCLGTPYDTTTYYKPWTPVSVDLTAYIGQNVTLEVTASACIYGGHSGYAYFDARLDSISAVPNVWPGDANYDLTADMNDLLYIGWAYGTSGPVRSGATNNWQAEPSANWGLTTPYGTEYKHADCNGDGIVNDDDTTALLQNYGLQHAFRMANPNQVTSHATNYRNLQITPSGTSVGPNQPVGLYINLPTNINTSNDIFGISFRLNTPSGFISSLSSVDFTNSFLGNTATNMLTVSKAFISQDHIDFCLVRKDHQNVTGGGDLLDIQLLSSNFIAGGTGNFSISSIKAITKEGAALPIGSVDAQVNFTTATSSIQKINTAEIKIVPNPASDKITFEGLTETKINFEIVNVIGQTILKSNLEGKKSLDVSGFEKGAYFIKLNTPQGIAIKKFIKE